MTFTTKVHRELGGDTETVEAAGKLEVKAGGALVLPVVEKTANFTLTAADSGNTFLVKAVDLVATLPATAAGLRFTFIVHTPSATTGFSVSTVAADAIHGNGLTSADDKDLINTAATDAEGDAVTLVGDGADGWWIESIVGTWAKEA